MNEDEMTTTMTTVGSIASKSNETPAKGLESSNWNSQAKSKSQKKQNRTKLKQIAKNTTFKRKENTETTKTEANLGRNLRANGDRSTAPTQAHTHTYDTQSSQKEKENILRT